MTIADDGIVFNEGGHEINPIIRCAELGNRYRGSLAGAVEVLALWLRRLRDFFSGFAHDRFFTRMHCHITERDNTDEPFLSIENRQTPDLLFLHQLRRIGY